MIESVELEVRIWTYNFSLYRDIYAIVTDNGKGNGTSVFTHHLQDEIEDLYNGQVSVSVVYYFSDEICIENCSKLKDLPAYLLIPLVSTFVALLCLLGIATSLYIFWYKPRQLQKLKIITTVQEQATIRNLTESGTGKASHQDPLPPSKLIHENNNHNHNKDIEQKKEDEEDEEDDEKREEKMDEEKHFPTPGLDVDFNDKAPSLHHVVSNTISNDQRDSITDDNDHSKKSSATGSDKDKENVDVVLSDGVVVSEKLWCKLPKKKSAHFQLSLPIKIAKCDLIKLISFFIFLLIEKQITFKKPI
ncbi:hypothetical protein RFI_30150 [Reticulomyxa filosa]|uniref:Uncharacterized protein n=1 Tax=Reticulomyxa filosa TaxID=46433 RepID=X6LZ83_RETFI|nr:hypothetical protein RFI_30150 [Reticulomyxa filosa]|eukprot:ETO07243.1 hypothetical protein RFI_30150 [Reticulomyxa filosa]